MGRKMTVSDFWSNLWVRHRNFKSIFLVKQLTRETCNPSTFHQILVFLSKN